MSLIYFEAENKYCHWYPFYLLPSNCYLFNDNSDDDNKGEISFFARHAGYPAFLTSDLRNSC